jgi:type VI secretion system protein ImpE
VVVVHSTRKQPARQGRGSLPRNCRLDLNAAVDVQLTRHLIRAEQSRRQFFSDGRVPDFLGPPSPEVNLRLQASIAVREGKPAQARDLLEQAESQRPRVRGTYNGRSFTDLRDLDDLLAGVLEVLTSNGKYYWVPIYQVELLECQPPKRMRDLLWRCVHMFVRGGPDGEVFLPVLYDGSHASADPRVQLGRMTDWLNSDSGPTRGMGQRTFLVDEECVPVLEVSAIQIHSG